MWTPDKVREELPNVTVKVNKKTYTGKVRGRKNRFATVYADVNGVEVSAEFAWQTISWALNYDKALGF